MQHLQAERKAAAYRLEMAEEQERGLRLCGEEVRAQAAEAASPEAGVMDEAGDAASRLGLDYLDDSDASEDESEGGVRVSSV